MSVPLHQRSILIIYLSATLYNFSIRKRRLNNTLKNSQNIKVMAVGPCSRDFRRRIAKNSFEFMQMSPKRVIFKLKLELN